MAGGKPKSEGASTSQGRSRLHATDAVSVEFMVPFVSVFIGEFDTCAQRSDRLVRGAGLMTAVRILTSFKEDV